MEQQVSGVRWFQFYENPCVKNLYKLTQHKIILKGKKNNNVENIFQALLRTHVEELKKKTYLS